MTSNLLETREWFEIRFILFQFLLKHLPTVSNLKLIELVILLAFTGSKQFFQLYIPWPSAVIKVSKLTLKPALKQFMSCLTVKKQGIS